MAYTKGSGIFLEESFLLEMMPGLTEIQIKIYIFAKYLAEKNKGKTDLQTISDALNLDVSTVRDNAVLLARDGIIKLGANGLVTINALEEKADIIEEKKQYLPGEVGAIINSDKNLSDMLNIAQKILGRLLSYQAIEKLYSLYDWLGMDVDVILRLLEYCAELGKKNISYIEKVAISWHEMGIATVDDAEEYIKHQNYKNSYVYKIQNLFGIDSRRLAASERKYIDSWYARGISAELASYAYDYSISKTGKFAMAYINKVLIAWDDENIKTPEQAQNSLKRYSAQNEQKQAPQQNKPSKNNLGVYNSGRYNYDEIDALARKKLKERLGKE